MLEKSPGIATKISSLLPKRGNRNAKRTEKHKNKTTQGKTQNKPPRRTNHKATKSKTNTGTTAQAQNGQQSIKKVREKSRECHNHKAQPFPDPKRKRKWTNPNKHKPNSTKISSLFPKRGNRNTKRIEKHKNKMTHGNT